ncbi:3-phenylpropionate/trans-cinnamate dioxygenase ferredoxin subunit [Mumia flava]|uniref:3-phenylpropionate/trans-cinnamate dioxygenase ferredoxin subunit n=2 Tax=Mumia flava TaxID=1348852 RepID=A0A0B2BNZ2_9ACTN|nr:bifunctional 3-phenylpropionate/cinnamic acid dioxygenase ferredoxin subunit [Mumia flava]PJJ57988.1 3-phenylpropionate/trans-cinnamate dioxygenase ferredoxin subunit [Mumia flava]
MLRVCSVNQLVPGEGLRIDALTPPIAVFLTEDGTVHALDDTCTHQDASLAAGWVEDCRVECPLHASSFSLLSGEVDQPPAKRPARVHHVEVRDGEVWVELSTAVPHLPPGVLS